MAGRIKEQETFNVVVEHLYEQGKPAYDPEGFCYYRSPEGLKCAVGCLIEDSEYDPDMEFTKVDDEEEAGDVRKLMEAKGHSIELLSDLQVAHDSWARSKGKDLKTLTPKLKHIANEWNLKFNV